MSSPTVAADNLQFKESDAADFMRGMFRMLWNSYSFFVLYADIDKWNPEAKKLEARNLLDKWILSELNMLIRDFNKHMEAYELNYAVRLLPKFIDNLSNWYIRRSRKRFWKSEDDGDKAEAYQTLYHVLIELSKIMAPFAPFMAEEIFKNLTGKESVHLEEMPMADESLIDEKLNEDMKKIRDIITEALQLRAKAGIKVRQPLSVLSIKYKVVSEELRNIISEEVNVKEVVIDETQSEDVVLNTEVSEELRLEGQAREIIRSIQEMRKEAGYEVDDRIEVGYDGATEVFSKFGDLIQKEVLATTFAEKLIEPADLKKELEVEGQRVIITIKK